MSAHTKSSHILLVEDDPVHADLVRVSIQECGTSQTIISHASDGQEAWEFLLQNLQSDNVNLPDIIVLDVRMPRMDGMELLKRIKSHDSLRMIPAIVLTTSASEDDRQRAYTNHANSFLTKPVDFEQFQSLVQELEHYWTSSNQPPPRDAYQRLQNAG